MTKSNTMILLLILFSFASFAGAGEPSFDCVIDHVYDVTDFGELKVSGFQDQFKGNSFTVSRTTGAIAGHVLTTILANKTSVINPGSDKNSFKAIAEFDGQFQLIEIQTFKKGKIKPFVATSMGGAGIVTGTCNCK